ncbi:MAG: DNA mismatch repair protein MutS [Terriglobia bacterium]
MNEFSTPLMRQYSSIKQRHPQALLFFRLGDFYELFFEDAVVAARELQITLTSRNKEKGQAIPMCGVPYHAAEAYIARLVRKGYRVAICDQMEDARSAQKLVQREVTRVVSPGTSLEAQALEPRANNYLAAVAERADAMGLAFADLSTGDFRATEFCGAEAATHVREELERMRPSEILSATADDSQPHKGPVTRFNPGGKTNPSAMLYSLRLDSAVSAALTPLEPWIFAEDYGARLLREHFRVAALAGYGLENHELAVAAAGAILHYIRETQRGSLLHFDGLRYYQQQEFLLLDPATLRNLEVTEPAFGSSRDSTLLSTLDHCMTTFGARLLKQRMLRPFIGREEIESRWEAVEELQLSTVAREELRHTFGRIQDLERLLSKIVLEAANARDLLALKLSLDELPGVDARLQKFKAPMLTELRERLDPLSDVRSRIEQSIHPEPPVALTEGGLIRPGYNAELDALRELSHNSKRVIVQIESRERERTGIASLKVRFNNIFGYYIEVSKPNLHLVPGDYERKQTLVNAERFTTPELKELETRILEAEEKRQTLERDLFTEVRRQTGAEARRIRATAAALAELDVLACFAWLAAERNYRRPELSDDGELMIVEGRHPVIEHIQNQTGAFIPNDLFMDASTARILILTGPNMGGKSTYLRQTALISLMAQMGGFVPASRAKLPILDRIFTRIGASDNLAQGRSTFMVEMTEVAGILNTATPHSLVLLDEVGRGTATFDGLAIAWAVVEYLQTHTQAKTLFATHYHELTELADLLPGIRNYHVSVKESGSSIVFLRKVEPGAADKSYGVEVARLAGLPVSVIERAREILARHEQSEHNLSERLEARRSGHEAGPVQLTIFTPLDSGILRAIEESDLDHMRPVDALALLAELKRQLQS